MSAAIARRAVLADQLGDFARRLVEDSLLAALPSVWERRAAELDAARPKPDDFHGAATPAELAERDRRCAEAAQACRDHAALLRDHADVHEVEVVAVVAEAFGAVAA